MLVSYDISRLMRLDVPGTRFIVTLGGADRVDPSTVIDTMAYEHPLYTPESVAAQSQLAEIRSPRVAFAGAYHGWGFHEDGALLRVVAAAAPRRSSGTTVPSAPRRPGARASVHDRERASTPGRRAASTPRRSGTRAPRR